MLRFFLNQQVKKLAKVKLYLSLQANTPINLNDELS